jgi:polar amino acid transport system permease protein
VTQQTSDAAPRGTQDTPPGVETLRVIPRRYPGRWVAVAVIALILVAIVIWAVGNKNFQWDRVGHYLFAPRIVQGMVNTLVLTVIAQAIGIVLGVVLAIMRMSDNRVISGFAFAYSWFFRGIPLLVLLLFIYFGSAIAPSIGIGAFSVDTNSIISSPFLAAIIGLSLNEGAYMSEIVRSGLLAVPEGQSEAAAAIGLTRFQSITRIVLPQAMRIIIPPTGNDTIGMLKNTALVIMIGYPELMTTVSAIYSQNYQNIPLLLVACFWYLLLTTVLSIGQHFIERHYGRGFQRR